MTPLTSQSTCSILSETSETEKVAGVKIDEGITDEIEGYTDNLEKDNGIRKDTPSDETIDKESSRSSGCDMSLINESSKKLKDCHLADFLGCVFGSTISSVYGKHFEKTCCQHDFSISVGGKEKTASIFNEDKHVSLSKEEMDIKSSEYVFDLMSDECCCYEITNDVDPDSPHFLEMPCISSTTVKT